MQNSISTSPSSLPSLKPYHETSPDEYLLYFCYGSNMAQKTQNWRELRFQSKFPCVLRDYRLVFDLRGLALFEGAFGNVKASVGDSVHGVGMVMTKKDFLNQVMLLESPSYNVEQVSVCPYGFTSPILAVTLKIPQSDGRYLYPSRRYLNLIISGAEENCLQSNYVEYLKSLPDGESSLSWCGRILRIFLMLFYIFPIILLLLLKQSGLLQKPFVHKVSDKLHWPLRNLPFYFIDLLPKGTIFNDKMKDAMEIRYKAKGN